MVHPETSKKGQSKKDSVSPNQSALKLQGAISLSNANNGRKVPKKKSSPSPDKKKPMAKQELKPKVAGPPSAKSKDVRKSQDKQQQPHVPGITA